MIKALKFSTVKSLNILSESFAMTLGDLPTIIVPLSKLELPVYELAPFLGPVIMLGCRTRKGETNGQKGTQLFSPNPTNNLILTDLVEGSPTGG